MAGGSGGLTAEQLARIEASRQAALRRRQELQRRASLQGGGAGPKGQAWRAPQPQHTQQQHQAQQRWKGGGGGSDGGGGRLFPPGPAGPSAWPGPGAGAQGATQGIPIPPHTKSTSQYGPPQQGRGDGGPPPPQQQWGNGGGQAEPRQQQQQQQQQQRSSGASGGGSYLPSGPLGGGQWGGGGGAPPPWQQPTQSGGQDARQGWSNGPPQQRSPYFQQQQQQQQQQVQPPQQAYGQSPPWQQQQPPWQPQQQQQQQQQVQPLQQACGQPPPWQQQQQQQQQQPPPPQQQQQQPPPQQQQHHSSDVAPPLRLAPIFNQRQPLQSQPQQQQRQQEPPPGQLAPMGAPVKAEIIIIDKQHFGVYQQRGNQAVMNALKHPELDGEWHNARRAWTFTYDKHDAVRRALAKLRTPQVTVEDMHKLPLAALKRAAGRPDDSPLWELIPSELESCLFPFQREGVEFGLRVGGRVILGDEMGLGKTLQALALMGAYSDDWPALVLCPSSLREMWRSMVLQWLPDLIKPSEVSVVVSGKDSPLDGKVCVVPYDYAAKLEERLKKVGFGVVVADEVHYLKSHKAQRTKAAQPVLEKARRAILLSGTPALSRPIELYTLCRALSPLCFKSYNAFGERYCNAGRWGFQGAANKEELNVVMQSMMIRRLKKDVLTQLPDKTRCQVFMSVPETRDFKALKAKMEDARSAMGSLQCDADYDAMMAANAEQKRMMNEFYNATAALKCGPVKEYVKEMAEGENKFLVFAHHQCVLDAAEQACNKAKVEYIRIDGSTPVGERHGLCQAFQAEDSNVRVAVLSIKAAGAGLTLTAASTVVFAEYTWVPGDLKQAEDRAHRIGQKNTVNIIYLHARNTVDDIIWRTVQNKLETVGAVLDGADNVKNVALNVTTNARANAPAAPRGRGQTTIASFMRKSDASSQDFMSTDEEREAKRRRTGGSSLGGSGGDRSGSASGGDRAPDCVVLD